MPRAALASVCATPSWSIAGKAMAFLLGHPHDAEPLGRKVFGELHVLERNASRGRERDRVPLVLRAKRPIRVVHRLEDAQAPAVARVDRHHQDGARPVAGASVHARVEPRIPIRLVYTKQGARSGHVGREARAVERKADLVDLEDTLAALPALGERARPELVPRLIDDVERRAVGFKHEGRGESDAQENLLDVGLEREIALELEQRLELLGLAQRCHSRGFSPNWSCAARGHTFACARAPRPDGPRRGAAHGKLLIGLPHPATNSDRGAIMCSTRLRSYSSTYYLQQP